MTKRISKHIINKEDVEFLLNVKEEDVTLSFIMEQFGEFNGKSRFRPYDTITIPKGYYGNDKKKNKNEFRTTVGRWIYNKYFIERDLLDVFGYVNKPITKKEFGKMNKKLSYALLEEDISLEQLKRYLMKTQKIMPYVSILAGHMTSVMCESNEKIASLKKKLLKENAEGIKNKDAYVADKIDRELLKAAREILQDDESMDYYNSIGSFDNNYKNMYVMKGATKDPDPNKGYNIATSNYMEGIKKEDYSVYANSLTEGPYSRAVKTKDGGYWEKLFKSAFQHIVLDKEGSDCGTDKYITVNLTDDNIDDYMYSYIIEGKNLIELNSKNRNKYVNKTVKFRFASMCKSKTGICNKCAGNLFYKLGIKNIGMATPTLASTLKNMSMSAFHDSTIKFHEIDVSEAFGIE